MPPRAAARTRLRRTAVPAGTGCEARRTGSSAADPVRSPKSRKIGGRGKTKRSALVLRLTAGNHGRILAAPDGGSPPCPDFPGGNRMKTSRQRPEEAVHNWVLLDASDMVLGRLARDIAVILAGRNKPTWQPDIECGDYVVV